MMMMVCVAPRSPLLQMCAYESCPRCSTPSLHDRRRQPQLTRRAAQRAAALRRRPPAPLGRMCPPPNPPLSAPAARVHRYFYNREHSHVRTGASFVANAAASHSPTPAAPSPAPPSSKLAALRHAQSQLQGMKADVSRMLRVTRAQVTAMQKSFQIAVDAAKTIRRTSVTATVRPPPPQHDMHPPPSAAAHALLCRNSRCFPPPAKRSTTASGRSSRRRPTA
jgi:hypothetical protein